MPVATRPPRGPGRAYSGSDIRPPPRLDADRHGGSGWVELVRASNDIEAHLIAGRLEAAGIETRKVKDRGAPGAWLYGGSNPWAPVALLVRKLQYEEGRIALAELAMQTPSAVAAGPERSRARTPTVWWSTALALGALLTLIALAEITRALLR